MCWGNRQGAVSLSLRRRVAQHFSGYLTSHGTQRKDKEGRMVYSLLSLVCEQAVVVIHRSGEECAYAFSTVKTVKISPNPVIIILFGFLQHPA